MSEDEEVHAKLYFLDYKGKVKEIRRMALHSKANWRQWPAVNALVNDMFSVNDSTVTYEDPDQDKVCLESQLEWDECLSLGPYGLHRPLKIHIKKKCHRGKTRADLVLEPTRFYESSGAPVSVDPEQQQMFKAQVPSIVKRYLRAGTSQSLPEWLLPAVKWLRTDDDINLDVNIPLLATCMTMQALTLMDDSKREYPAALMLLLEAQMLSPSAGKLYNIACCQALMGSPEGALESLNSAVALGYNNFSHMLQDDDLASLRSHAGFACLVAGARTDMANSADDRKTPSSVAASVEVVPEPAVPVSPVQVPEPQHDAEQEGEQQPPTMQAPQDIERVVSAAENVAKGISPESLSAEECEGLERLRMMGFLDEEKNLQCLRQSDWSLTAAVDKLVS
uniref:UBA domain-containing protein n=1 Tax=Eutreptiella gymnastica TaxID=73025 RepID=A0A7S4G573_9EUGL